MGWWWCTGHGSPSQVWWPASTLPGAGLSIGTLCTDLQVASREELVNVVISLFQIIYNVSTHLMEPVPGMRSGPTAASWGGTMG